MVQVSSVAAVGYADDPARPSTRTLRSRRVLAEPLLAYQAAGRGGRAARSRRGSIVLVCPGFLLGAGDVNRINTFVVEGYLRGRLRTTVAGRHLVLDVRDVAEGLLAAERRG